MELNREQIIKALECCTIWGGCDNCPFEPKGDCYKGSMECGNELMKNALSLITSQEQRIKELTEENERLKASRYMVYPDGRLEPIPSIESIKADTVRKMQDRVQAFLTDEETDVIISEGEVFIPISAVRKIAKEMIGDTNDNT